MPTKEAIENWIPAHCPNCGRCRLGYHPAAGPGPAEVLVRCEGCGEWLVVHLTVPCSVDIVAVDDNLISPEGDTKRI
ncbi:MAG: hypothetical protein ACE5FA_06280 [Dehalococcoidia bacterium]